MNSRVLPLEGGINFRDLGGYKNREGRAVRWRKLLRSGHLASLTDDDLLALQALDVTQVHDFRRREEQQRTPSKSWGAQSFADYQMYVGSLSRFWDYLESGQLSAGSAHQLVSGSYSECIEDVIPAYSQMFEALLENRENASLFHCSAGKDRTGMAAALILSALDVPRETIIEDYLLTLEHFDSDGLIEIIEGHLRAANVSHWERSWLVPYAAVHEENIVNFFTAIDQRFGSMEVYLNSGLGLDGAKLALFREGYLES